MDRNKIIVAEDENIIGLRIKDKLEKMGYTVTAIVSSGEEAVSKTYSTMPDLILMDIRLKGQIDGVEAASQIRDKFDIPVIYLTAYSDEEILERAKKTEPYGYILKPFTENDLRTNIKMAFYKHYGKKND
ncbi:response regulator receiver protein [Methanosalsum zhilinae DSM 4017]|uniref:Response regulator receiver protein n=1 Tax=Methanosalsum zhilinae (strain DSM 4017 / NBRC 107636 / OCM 62 / WeN5) TaxID=679901 RepID=F7XQH3_METZD|nr:response regulator [Methanosalsum zhilinae]AEH60474.1 response regulator receiver protein [Methanosalsum zhilinae DSM 4017]